VLRYWEQEFTQLKPVKRRGNRRYYQHHEVILIRRIRDLLYEQGFTINGARHQLEDNPTTINVTASAPAPEVVPFVPPRVEAMAVPMYDWNGLRAELEEVDVLLQTALVA
jgi:DNA-binding transcriptional MerR regulator